MIWQCQTCGQRKIDKKGEYEKVSGERKCGKIEKDVNGP